MGDLLPPPGEPITPEEVTAPKARELVGLLRSERLNHVAFVAARRDAEGEVVVFDIEPEVPQVPVAPIASLERIAVTFYIDDDRIPETVALRSEFPRDVTHLNLRPFGYPWASLCLYEEHYSDLKLRWTAAGYLRRVQEWLSLTARGELHQEDQPLEPFLLARTVPLILPPDLFESGRDRESLIARGVRAQDDLVLIAQRGRPSDPDEIGWLAIVVEAEPQVHGVIRHQPQSLAQLHDVLRATGHDLVPGIRQRLVAWRHEDRALLRARLVFIAHLPQTRTASSSVEALDVWAFVTEKTGQEIGQELGLWEVLPDGQIADLLMQDLSPHGEAIDIHMLRPIPGFSREGAALLSGLTSSALRVTAVGAGTLGSQVIMNAVRTGFGDWTIVDDDHLLPHNLARHALPGDAVGFPKATSLAIVANGLFSGEPVARGIVANVLKTADDLELQQCLREADLIVDMAASATVARHLAIDVESPTRRISLFLNPDGTALVMLAEDMERGIRLDDLEMQYYREIIRRPDLEQHLRPGGHRLRYGQSCRDVTAAIPQDVVSVQAGIGARAIRRAAGSNGAAMMMWRIDGEELGVEALRFAPSPIVVVEGQRWTVRADEALLRRLRELRAERLPSETGGILIGHHDLQHRIIYVVDALPAPPDSRERPVFFDRGCTGLRKEVEEIEAKTAGALVYVGEWHSHPDGHGIRPSTADQGVFRWLANHLEADGLPPLMVIVGEQETALYFEDLT